MNKYTKEVKDINTVTKKFNELFNNNLDHIDLCNQISHLTVQVLLFHNQSINEINNIFSNAIKKGIMKQKKEIENKYQDLKQKLKNKKGN